MGGSITWQQLQKLKEVAEYNTKWVVGKGNSNFWKDSWLDIGKLCDVVDITQVDQKLKVCSSAAGNFAQWRQVCADFDAGALMQMDMILSQLNERRRRIGVFGKSALMGVFLEIRLGSEYNQGKFLKHQWFHLA